MRPFVTFVLTSFVFAGAVLLATPSKAAAKCDYSVTYSSYGTSVDYQCGTHGWQCLYDSNGRQLACYTY